MLNANDFRAVIRFTYEGGNRGERRAPFEVSWRQLPSALIESPDGGKWILEIEGQPPMTVSSGEALVIPRGVFHRLRMTGASLMHTTWMMANFEGLAGMDLLVAARIPTVLPRPAGKRLSRLMACARELDAAIGQGDLSALARRQTAGFQILDVLIEYAGVRHLAPSDPELERLLPVLQYVETNLDKTISVCELARQACLSPSRFHGVFKRVLNISPMIYVQKARIRLAQHLLITSSRPIGEIATLAGFSSPYYFSRAFHSYTKTTPTAFRQDPNWYQSTKIGSSSLRK